MFLKEKKSKRGQGHCRQVKWEYKEKRVGYGGSKGSEKKETEQTDWDEQQREVKQVLFSKRWRGKKRFFTVMLKNMKRKRKVEGFLKTGIAYFGKGLAFPVKTPTIGCFFFFNLY